MPPFDDSQVRIILLDIEGTTTHVDFVTKVLFPYASQKLEGFLREKCQEPQVAALIADLRTQREQDARNNLKPPKWKDGSTEDTLRSAVTYCQWLMQRDSKCTSLKSLQGMIWEAGYTGGELQGQVYSDVPVAFDRWRKQKREIVIYSSGSVLAQQLLFSTTPFGDLTKFIRAYFDTHVGAKSEPASYARIADSLEHSPDEILFLSDVSREVDAARSAGMYGLLCDRSEPIAESSSGSGVVRSFDDVFPS